MPKIFGQLFLHLFLIRQVCLSGSLVYVLDSCQCLVLLWNWFLEPEIRHEDQRRVNKTEKSVDLNPIGSQNYSPGKTYCLVNLQCKHW